jgi:hypothetical protein
MTKQEQRVAVAQWVALNGAKQLETKPGKIILQGVKDLGHCSQDGLSHIQIRGIA